MKFKEILTNKWGGVGAIIGFVGNQYFRWYPKCGQGICGFSPMAYLIYGLGFAIAGFILGLILNKLYRKFK